MANVRSNWAVMALGVIVASVIGLAMMSSTAEAQQIYRPGIWIDPDGCEHWAMDDGAEGYMSPHRTRDGRPVCHRSEICGVMSTDTLFATDSHHINASNRQRLQQFFQSANAFGYLIYGHTDERASYEYNIALSNRRANAVAQVAQSIGARIVDVQGYGESQPRAQGHNEHAWRQNRRVEIYCLR
ncbi:Peptidoglycan-associated lipoprotein precursor [Roseisalinus antarcticus]|uniref:Peptidoglycan-associated lipoprotein n=2 Tax=Roseisalinus antarcticus TaxID=254357 RepID=A0A1Y5TR89_9RHOB|nr:Peptidoglycan-associated lipoprotein precursor [Roseisalinus antarcticus]